MDVEVESMTVLSMDNGADGNHNCTAEANHSCRYMAWGCALIRKREQEWRIGTVCAPLTRWSRGTLIWIRYC